MPLFDQEALIRSVAVTEPRRYMLFCGAGTSASSGIPTAGQCIWRWKQEIYLSKNPHLNPSLFVDPSLPSVQSRIQHWLAAQGEFPIRNADGEYAFYVEYAYPNSPDRQRYFERLFERAEPQAGYRLLATLQNALTFQWVWTANFDGLVLQAREPHHKTPIKELGLDTWFRAESLTPTDLSGFLVYLHGDYRYDSLQNTESETQTLDKNLRQIFVERLQQYPLIVIGYGGWDESVLSAMETAYGQRQNGGSLYWCVRFGETPNDRVQRLLELANDNGYVAHVVEIEDFDDLMIRLARFVLRDRPEADEVERVLSGQSPSRQSFRMPDFAVDENWLKSNALPVTLPNQLYQFTVAEMDGWKELRALVENRAICAGLLRGKVLAIGDEDEIRDAFGKRLSSDIESIPLDASDFRDSNSVTFSILQQGLQRGLAIRSNCNISGKRQIWDRHSSIEQIGSEILGLSKMDWNSFDLYSKMPATLESSRAIARVGQLLTRFGNETYDYRLFI